MHNTSLENATESSMIVPSQAEGIAWCSGFFLISVFIFAGNLLTIVLFAVDKSLRKKSLFLVINMAFADLVLGTVTLPIYIYADVGANYQLWTGGWTAPLDIFFMSVNTTVSQASLISAAFISCERFYAIYWPFKHKTLSMRAYRIVIFVVWTLALLITVVCTSSILIHFISYKHFLYIWSSNILILLFIVCGCNLGIWRKFKHGRVPSQQQHRASQNKRLTKTLFFVSVLALLSWIPLTIVNSLIEVFYVPITWRFYYLVVILNCSNSFVNPVVYALRIPEFKQALTLCCHRGELATNYEKGERRNDAAAAMTEATQLRTLRALTQQANEQQIMQTKL